jgi:hypothetical protein
MLASRSTHASIHHHESIANSPKISGDPPFRMRAAYCPSDENPLVDHSTDDAARLTLIEAGGT